MNSNASRLLPWTNLASAVIAAALATGCVIRDPPPKAPPPPPLPVSPALPPAGASGASLVAEGEARFKAYKCSDCHGARGEGTDDAPDLTGTLLDAQQIASFLQKPSAHARSVGMPSIPADSADLQPLVAFVLSLKRPR